MFKNRLVVQDTYYVGGSDRRLALFENHYPLFNGMSYNSYVILDEKTALMDTVDESIVDTFLTKLQNVLDGRKLDYIVIHHMEPDHSASLLRVLDLYPDVTLVVNQKILDMLKNYFEGRDFTNVKIVKELDTLELGKHTLTFVMAPMVHWPEVMMSYDSYSKSLFSADAFGTFAPLSGNLFAHEVNFNHEYLDETRRYYTNIVGKYGNQVQAVLKKAKGLDIENLCPLHGPIWRQDLSYILSLYDKWSRYEPEENGVLIVYGSVYGHTERVANMIADELSLLGIKDIHMFDAAKTDTSYLLSEAFKYSHIVIASSTYNMGIFTPMEHFLLEMKAHNLQNRKVAIIENGSWAPNSGKLIREILGSMKNMEIVEPQITVKSNVKENQVELIKELATNIAKDFPKARLNSNPMFNIEYGLYVLTTERNGKQNGMILNTLNQVASSPDLLFVSVNKNNYSAETILETKKFNVSVLNTHAPFALFKRFGFASGRDTDKFKDCKDFAVAANGINYITRYSNAFFSLEVQQVLDLGSHYGFICTIAEKKQLSHEKSVTYDFYMENIKPKTPREVKKVGWICKICGYIYEGEVLPPDFICPLCKHPASDFEKLK